MAPRLPRGVMFLGGGGGVHRSIGIEIRYGQRLVAVVVCGRDLATRQIGSRERFR
jgi:hypothetical protein